MKKQPEYFIRCRVIDKVTGAELYSDEWTPLLPREALPENPELPPALAKAKKRMEAHASEAASEIYRRCPEAFGG